MPANVIKVDPQSIRSYAQATQGHADGIGQELKTLASEIVSVSYQGPNAFQFKTEGGNMASAFASKLGAILGDITTAVRHSTSNISNALGGAVIPISLTPPAVVVPAVPIAGDIVSLETSGLRELIGHAGGHRVRIHSHLDGHLRSLRNTDWLGIAKDTAESEVSQLTAKAKATVDDGFDSITKFIQKQIDAVEAADR
jgi:hypothetical protein